MSEAALRERQEELIHKAVARLRASIMAVVFGMLGGTGLFLATAWLLVRGGKQVGLHLGLLSNYFPGYAVSWPGAGIGFFYGALSGAILGYALAWLYNRVVDLRHTG